MGRKYRTSINSDDHRIRQRTSYKTNCTVALRARHRADGSWGLTYIEGKGVHNHEGNDAATYPEHRQLTDAQIELVASHHATRVPPSRSLAILRQQEPNTTFNHRDMYNITAGIVREGRKGKAPAEALIAQLEADRDAGRVVFEYETDSTGHIKMLFVADVRSVEYLNKHPDILLLDCTYKTNKFDMPLLNCIGIDHHNNSFQIGLF